MTRRLLIIEDDADIAKLVCEVVQDAGYHTTHASTAIQGLIAARETRPDLVLLDLKLPDMHGSEVVRRLSRTAAVRIIVLSAADQVGQKVDLLDIGASDYLTKPFAPEELVARIHVQLRHARSCQTVQVGDLTLDLHQLRCVFQGIEVHLTRIEFDVLRLLAQRPDRVYTRADIAQNVWSDDEAVPNGLLDVHMANLRGKFREVNAHGLIRTVRGVGFTLRSSIWKSRTVTD